MKREHHKSHSPWYDNTHCFRHWRQMIRIYYRALTATQANVILSIMKAPKPASRRDTISTHEMRFEFDRVLRAVKAGRSLTLTYRNKPLARIVPLKEDESVQEDDPIFRLDELAEPIGPLTNAQIDALVYGQ